MGFGFGLSYGGMEEEAGWTDGLLDVEVEVEMGIGEVCTPTSLEGAWGGQ